MRSLILFAALLTTSAIAQRSIPTDIASKAAPSEGSTVAGGTISVKGAASEPGSVFLRGGMVDPPQVAIVMDRDFRDAIQGNLDRETIERTNGETR